MISTVILSKSRSLLRPSSKSISTFIHLNQQSTQLADPTPLPPNPATGSPLYNNTAWRNPNPIPIQPSTSSLIPLNFRHSGPRNPDCNALLDQFADWVAAQRWEDIKYLFEKWVRTLDVNGKPNKPDVGVYNQYLRANLMMNVSAAELVDLVEQMGDFGVVANAASFNLVLRAMQREGKTEVAKALIERMLQTGKQFKESLPNDESYDIVIGMLFSTNQIDSALKYIDLTLKSGYMLSMNVFKSCLQSCASNGRLDTLVSIIERCKSMDQNKFACPPWGTCNYIADVATQSDNSELTYYALEFMVKWIIQAEKATPPAHLSVDEGLVISALGTAARTYSAKLLDGSWAVLKKSLRKKKVPNPESYVGKINAHASMDNLEKAFSTLREFETAHGNTTEEDGEGFFSPFYSLNPLVAACSANGFTTLDSVYFQLEKLSNADPPYKSVAALNCIILGCANIWDVDRAFQTFSAITSTFGLTPNVHSYNALICAFGKQKKRDEAVKVFDHFVGLGVKPNMTTYSLLVDSHLIQREPKAALSVVDNMIHAGYDPSREMLKKIRRRCIRELDNESNDKVESLARQFQISMGTEARRNMLFNLTYSTDNA